MIFGLSYGLQSNQFNRRATIKCNDGRFIFGGIEGFNVFHPEKLESEKNALDVIITDLKLFFLIALTALTLHQSNSTLLPIL